MKWKSKVLLATTVAAVLAVCARGGANAGSGIFGQGLLQMLLCAPRLSAVGANSVCPS